MPKFARPNSYNGKQSNQNWTGSTRAATESEAAAGEETNTYISPATLASAVGTLAPHATTTVYGVVQLTDNNQPVATKNYVDTLSTTANVTSIDDTDTPYAILDTDFYVACDVTSGILTITLPAAPATGRHVIISDAVGESGTNTITIDGNGKNISLAGTSAATKTIATDFTAVELYYNGTLWNGAILA